MEEKAQLSNAPLLVLIGACTLSLAVNLNRSFISNRSVVINVIVTLSFMFSWLCFSLCGKRKKYTSFTLFVSGITSSSILSTIIIPKLTMVATTLFPYALLIAIVILIYANSMMVLANWNIYFWMIMMTVATFLLAYKSQTSEA